MENLKRNVMKRKYKGKVEEKKWSRKIKNIFKINKLFLYTNPNLFYLFFLFYVKIK